MTAGSYYLGYRESREYGGKDGISIGTATAISGAAVSPNMDFIARYSAAADAVQCSTRLVARESWHCRQRHI